MEFYTFKLNNGIRVIHKQVDSPVSHCGLIINAGSRDEAPHETGLAHFIEHVLFKGTKKRKTFHILSRMEDVGGELNAYTTREDTFIYASFMAPFYERAIELIADISFNSIFPKKELEREKDVILDEINSYKDSPADAIFDDFEELLYPNHPLGENILGTPERVKSFTKENILQFIRKNYNTDEMVFSSVGNISPDKLQKYLAKHLEIIPANLRTHQRIPVQEKAIFQKESYKEIYQSHSIIGTQSMDASNPQRHVMYFLNNILGGPGMNSRLNLAIREKYGFAYSLESSYTPLSDTGIFSIYFGTDPQYTKKCTALVWKEMRKLKNNALGPSQIKKAKQQMIGQIAISQENNCNLMQSIAKSYLTFNKVDSLEEVNQKIMSISASALQDLAQEVLQENKFSSLQYKPKK
jgi:predicted Zn-dependent peptidase